MLDLLIVGGGPAGLATAIHARQAGLSALICEPRGTACDKACGEGLMPGSLAQLAAMGVELSGGHALSGIRFVAGRSEAHGRFRPGPGLGVRRTVLHAALLSRALALGATLIPERIDAFEQTSDHVVAGAHQARWLVAADGLRSRLRRRLGLELPPRLPPRYGVRGHYARAPWSDEVEVHWGRRCELYITPVAPDLINVAVLSATSQDYNACVAEFPRLFDALGPPIGPLAGAGPFERRVRARWSGRVLLVGDAAGYLDPLTGEGNHLAFGAAQALVDCLVAGRPQDYDRRWRQLARAYWLVTSSLLAATRSPRTRPLVTKGLALHPPLFDRVLGLLG